MNPTLRPVILSGGVGTRLWPLSTKDTPKQFLELLGEPLFEATLARAMKLGGSEAIIVTGSEQIPAVEKSLADMEIDDATIVVEPSGRNTAPAVVAAALVADPLDVLVVLPSDHLMTDEVAFRQAVIRAVDVARDGALVTFGIEPSRPETGYGYIEIGEPIGPGFHIARFKEKPDEDEAAQLVTGGAHLWNSGMFVFGAAQILGEARRQAPGIVTAVEAALPTERSGTIRLDESFSGVPSISIDHAIMEGADNGVVIPMDAGWSDVGSWQSVWELSDQDEHGNSLVGDVVAIDVADNYVRSETKAIAIAGVTGLVVIVTPDVVLIVPKEKSQMVRDLAEGWEASRPAD
ncbi:MAG TPA: sugar phosphate nucleotidyltransferase [Acidimicrobiia bacterium]|nr:sugar phosphate nucleotidyltransferase [Acidimicrobiia bacterium]